MNWNRLLLIQIQPLPPSMYHKWNETMNIVFKTTNGKLYKTNFQREGPLSWKDNSNVLGQMRSSISSFDWRRCFINVFQVWKEYEVGNADGDWAPAWWIK